MPGFSAANRSPLVGIVILFLLTLHGFRCQTRGVPLCGNASRLPKIQHFATKAIFEMGYEKKRWTKRVRMPITPSRKRIFFPSANVRGA